MHPCFHLNSMDRRFFENGQAGEIIDTKFFQSRSLALSVHKVGYARQIESKLSLRSLALPLQRNIKSIDDTNRGRKTNGGTDDTALLPPSCGERWSLPGLSRDA